MEFKYHFLNRINKDEAFCRKCHKKVILVESWRGEMRCPKSPSLANTHNHWKRLGITINGLPFTREDYALLFKKQGGLCAICLLPERIVRNGKLRPLSVDHDHKTGRVRGLLCQMCNAGLGNFVDSRKLLSRARNYLKSHKQGGV